MGLIQKTDPVGIDVSIDNFQLHLDNALTFSDWDNYHRVYLNPSENGLVPERYKTDGNYNEVFYNDKFNITTWFFTSSERPVGDGGLVETTVSLIVQADLVKLYPSIAHRADEELNNAFSLASESFVGSEEFKLESIWTTLDKVYQEFDKGAVTFDNMSNRYVVRFNYKVSYAPNCVS